MKNIFHNLPLLALALVYASCHSNNTRTSDTAERDSAVLISTTGANASSPYFTKDQNSNPVLCWTEEQPDGETFVLKFAVYHRGKRAFDTPVTVIPSKGTSPHPESMNKVAFKGDGTIVAVYAKKHPTEENPFAGSILYSLSSDQGRTWTAARTLHSDTLATYGRSFFDIATLPDGEIGAVWLDGRFGEADHGSALFFSKTRKGDGFGRDKQIGESTCECCRTELYVDRSGRVHIAYRDIIGENIRDIVYQRSDDSGETFSVAQRVSRDNWEIDGCPHTGPSLAANEAGLHAVWFTAGGGAGVYRAILREKEQSFSVRQKISEDARHPQLAALPDGKLAVVWDEVTRPDNRGRKSHSHSTFGHPEETGSKVILQTIGKNSILKTIVLTGPVGADHAVLEPIDESTIVVAWVQRNASESGVYFKRVGLTSTGGIVYEPENPLQKVQK